MLCRGKMKKNKCLRNTILESMLKKMERERECLKLKKAKLKLKKGEPGIRGKETLFF